MSRTLKASGPATKMLALIAVDDDGTTLKDHTGNIALALNGASAENARPITWNGKNVIAKYNTAQVAPFYDLTHAAGTLTDPGCVFALIYNQSGAAPINRSILECTVGNGAGIQSKSDGSGKFWLSRTYTDAGYATSSSAPGAGVSYFIAFNFNHSGNIDCYYATAGGALAVASKDSTQAAGATITNATGHYSALFYKPGAGVGWPGEPVMVGVANQTLDPDTEMTNINQDPYGTLFGGMTAGARYYFLQSMQQG